MHRLTSSTEDLKLGNKLLRVAWVGDNDCLLFPTAFADMPKALHREFQVTNTRENGNCGHWPPYAAMPSRVVQFTCHFLY